MTIYVIYHGPREHASVAFATSTEHLCVAFLGAPQAAPCRPSPAQGHAIITRARSVDGRVSYAPPPSWLPHATLARE